MLVRCRAGPGQQRRARGTDGSARRHADREVRGGVPDGAHGAEALLAGDRGDGEEHDRRGQPVVEPALHVEHPPDPDRDPRVEHRRSPECGIGRCQGSGQQQGHHH